MYQKGSYDYYKYNGHTFKDNYYDKHVNKASKIRDKIQLTSNSNIKKQPMIKTFYQSNPRYNLRSQQLFEYNNKKDNQNKLKYNYIQKQNKMQQLSNQRYKTYQKKSNSISRYVPFQLKEQIIENKLKKLFENQIFTNRKKQRSLKSSLDKYNIPLFKQTETIKNFKSYNNLNSFKNLQQQLNWRVPLQKEYVPIQGLKNIFQRTKNIIDTYREKEQRWIKQKQEMLQYIQKLQSIIK